MRWHAAGGCQGAGGGAGRGMEGSVSHGSSRLELVVESKSDGSGLAHDDAAATNDLELQALC